MKNKIVISELLNADATDSDLILKIDHAVKDASLWPEAKNVNHPVVKFSNNSLRMAKKTIPHVLPTIAKAGVEMMGEGGTYGAGLPLTIFGAVADVVKFPFVLLAAGAEATVGGTTKLIAKLFKNNIHDWELNRFNLSFMNSFAQTAQLLVDMQLESIDDIKSQVEAEQNERLVALTCLQIAYASRHYADGILLVSANEKLTFENCPEDAKAIFDKIMKLKALINQAIAEANIDIRHSYYINEEAKLFGQWFRVINDGFDLGAADILQESEIPHAEILMQIIDELTEDKVSAEVEDALSVRRISLQ